VRQKVDVEVRGIRLDDLARGATRVVDPVAHELVPTPTGSRLLGGFRVEPSELGPPFRFQPGLEGVRIRRADDVAAYTLGILGDKDALRAVCRVGRGIHMSQQFRIAIEDRGVIAPCARRQTYAVEVIQVGRPKGADFDHSRFLA